MSEKICPVCNRANLPNAKRCWYCQSLLEDEPVIGEPGEGAEAVEQPEPEKEVPDWLARIRARKAIESMEPQPKEEVPAPEKKTEEPKPVIPEKPASSVPSGKTGSISRRPGIQLPSWITELEKEAKPAPEDVEPFKPPAKKTESSDWMKKLSAWQAEEEHGGQEAAKAEPDNTPEWLTEFLSKENAPQPESGLTPAEEFNQQLQSAEPQPGDTEPLGPLTEDEEAIRPDETYDFSQDVESPTPKEEEEIPPVDERELEAGFTPLSVELPSEPAAKPPSIEPQPVEEGDIDLEWLEEYDKAVPKEAAPEEPVEEEAAAESEAAQPQEPITKPLTPFLGVKKNDWNIPFVPLAAKAEEASGEEETANEGEEDALKLPVWMEQLRRIEMTNPATPSTPPAPEMVPPAASPEPEEQPPVEGPLAGIQGALRSAELPDLYSKPPIYTNRIQVTDRQALRADLLSNLLQESPAAVHTEEAAPKTPAKSRLRKILVGLLVLAVVLLVLVGAPGTSLLPVLYPPETASVYQLVNALPADKPVLIAADFDAGLSGEIGYTSQAFFEHLMLRNIPMATLSTNPAGSALMGNMLSAAQARVSTYDLAARTVQFGYLAGGSVALQSMASDVHMALPYTAELFPAWTNPLLVNIQKISDFGALVVMTDDADTGRYWVEQVQPALEGIPLIVVTSAQSAPMLLPYYESGQINGVIAGMAGGTAYEQILQIPGESTFYFGAYQSLVLVVFVLILIGGVVALVMPQENGHKD